MNPITCVAAATCSASLQDWQENFQRMEDYAHQAKKQGAGLLLLPEAGLTGYPSTQPQRALFPLHPLISRVQSLAAKLDIVLAPGMVWQKQEGANLQLVQALFLPDGRYFLYGKTHLGSREKDWCQAGDELPVFDLPGLRVGFQLCLEHHFPDITQTLALRGAQLVLCPHATPRLSPVQRRESWHIALRARAYDNCVYILATNQQGRNEDGQTYPGGSLAVDPYGKVLTEDFSGQPGLIFLQLEAEKLAACHTTPGGKCRRFYPPSRRAELYD